MPDLFDTKTAAYGPRLMSDLGLADFQAAGVFGNIGHECGGFKLMQEIKPTVAGSRGGFGWCQWTGPRRVSFETWCKSANLKPDSDEANYGYLLVELRGPENGALVAVKKTRALADATDAFCKAFERPGVVNLPSRMTWANRALTAIRSAQKPPEPAICPTCKRPLAA